jgi:hypothetical protein
MDILSFESVGPKGKAGGIFKVLMGQCEKVSFPHEILLKKTFHLRVVHRNPKWGGPEAATTRQVRTGQR